MRIFSSTHTFLTMAGFLVGFLAAQTTGAIANDGTPTQGLSICNNTDSDKIYIVIVAPSGDQWMVEGWWSAERGQCRYVSNRRTAADTFIFVEDTDQNVWSGDFKLCVNNSSAFEYPISDGALTDSYFETPRCSDGNEVKGFIRIATTPNAYEVINVDFVPGYYLDQEFAFGSMFQ